MNQQYNCSFPNCSNNENIVNNVEEARKPKNRESESSESFLVVVVVVVVVVTVAVAV